jgi:steroid delta-isomerase-like uncharacterized protein
VAETETETKRRSPAKKRSTKSASGEKPKTRRPRRSAKSRAVEEAARGYLEAVGSRDLNGMVEHLHAEMIDDIIPLGVFRGPAEVRAVFTDLFAAVPDFFLHVERVVADDRVAAVEYRMGGTFDGAPFQGIEPTGRKIELRGCDLVEVEDGKVVRNTGYYDGAAFARAVGLLPPQDSGAERAMTGAFNLVTKARRAVAERRGG